MRNLTTPQTNAVKETGSYEFAQHREGYMQPHTFPLQQKIWQGGQHDPTASFAGLIVVVSPVAAMLGANAIFTSSNEATNMPIIVSKTPIFFIFRLLMCRTSATQNRWLYERCG